MSLEGIECLSLDELERSLASAIRLGALVIYWHHGLSQFRHMNKDDNNTMWREEMKLLRSHWRKKRIISITAGPPISIDGVTLYSMEVDMKDLECYAYFLLCKRGELGDADKTPYFFRNESTRNQTLAWLMRD